jgi:hypothetical protein
MPKFLKVGNIYLNIDHIISVNIDVERKFGPNAVRVATTEMIQGDIGASRWLDFAHGTDEAKIIVAWLEYNRMVKDE